MNEKEFDKKWNGKYMEHLTHTEPSPETRERLAILETNQKNMMEKLDQMNTSNEEQHQNIINMIVSIESKLDKALEKKADKWVERVFIWLGSIIGLGLLGVVGTLIIKAIIHFNI